ncbi:MAG: SDR family oxidoreductase [Deltaproteobacteria bacterium]|nr:SDR family oxidoreductase [Deltaproteobacteria bacterium]
MPGPIAIVGMACHYPDAESPAELFENVLAGRRAFRRIPDERLALADYGSDDPDDVDRTYLTQAALIEGYEFDRTRFKIVGSTYRQADLTHWLALDVAERALRDAGFEDGEGLPRERTGVLLGNTLTGEFSRAQMLRLRWPYVQNLLESELREVIGDDNERARFIEGFEARYKAPFEPFGDESLAGGLSNTIAGRICNYFDLKGGGYTLDGACSSSLLALSNACTALEIGDLDVALAGGVDLSLDPFELVGFSRAGALARDEMRVYEQRSAGFWPGEGCGFVVLMREADAGDRRIYARIRGWGISSDGAGGISRPEEAGQALALERAYARAGFGPESVGYFEGHGTGTVVGDTTELRALTRVIEEGRRKKEGRGKEGRAADDPPISIGSIKANIGHTKAAAGIAGVIKASLALHHRVIPPMPTCERPHELVDPERGAALQVEPVGRPWPEGRELRAGISSMGFGGINSHVVLDGVRDGASQGRNAQALDTRDPERMGRLVGTAQDAELFLLGAGGEAELLAQVDRLLTRARGLSRADLTDLSAALAANLSDDAPLRAAIVAVRPEEFAARLETLRGWIEEWARAGDSETGRSRLSPERGIFLGAGGETPAIGFLFPGQGAPVTTDLGALGRYCDAGEAALAAGLHAEVIGAGSRAGAGALPAGAADSFRAAGALPAAGAVPDTSLAQPAIVAASLASAALLEEMGIRARAAVGHSLGEISALGWAGALDSEGAVELSRTRGRIMSELALGGGTMASLAASPEQVSRLIEDEPCTLAAQNGPRRCVISGERAAVERIVEAARKEGFAAVGLAVSHAFHSSLVEPCAPALAEALCAVDFQPFEGRVFSTCTGEVIPSGSDLHGHLVEQLMEPVRFFESVERASEEVDLFIEVGPGRMLSGLVREFSETPAIALETGGGRVRGLLEASAAAYALGAQPRWSRLFGNRVTKPFDLDATPLFFANPCSAPHSEQPAEDGGALAPAPEPAGDTHARSALDVVIALVANRCELPPTVINSSDRFLSDLHLTSIAVSTIAAEAGRALGRPPLVAPSEFADATVAELAEAIDCEDRVLAAPVGVPGVDSWLRPFVVSAVERPCPRAAAHVDRAAERSEWQTFAPPGDAFAETLSRALQERVRADGVLVHLPPSAGASGEGEGLQRLLEASQAAYHGLDSRLFVLVHHGDASVAVARTLHQEARSLTTRVVEVPENHPDALEWVLAEARAAASYLECRYDERGVRSERRLRPLPVKPSSEPFLPLGADDVLVVSGGGKGIAAECALALARETGCALGIIGRSSLEGDLGEPGELRENLARFAAAGARYVYAAADVGDAEAVARAVQAIETELGPVTGLLHAAGINTPRSLLLLEARDFHETLAPKVSGLENLLAHIDPTRLRCVMGFGSVVAQIGLPGEADYAYANERLSQSIEAYAESHPETRCLCLEWSIWSGVGMGERLGRVETLAHQNISAISPEDGVAWLLELLSRADLPVRVFLAGRFGTPPTLAVEECPLPIARFLERIREHTPGVELVVDAELSLASDPYLADHVYAGSPLLPGVMGLEAMAQVAAALTGDEGAPIFERVEFMRPVEVPPDGKRTVRVAGLMRDDGSVELVLRCDASDFQVNHMRAALRFDPAHAPGPADPALPEAGEAPELDPERELYGDLFFHDGRFRRVRRYRTLRGRSCVAEIDVRDENFFGAFQPQALVLGDPGARDAAIHAIQACVPHRDLLPVGVESIHCGALGGDAPLLLHARERSRSGDFYTYDLQLVDAKGRALESWVGLKLQAVSGAAPRESWPAPLLGPRLEELAEEQLACSDLRAALVAGSDRAASERAAAVAAGDGETLRRRSDGKPLLESGRSVSTSHGDRCTLAVVARQPVACDLEQVTSRPAEIWQDLLGPEHERLARVVAAAADETFDASATRVWGAQECLRKLGLQRETPITLGDAAGEADCVRFEAGSHSVVSLKARIQGSDEPVVITLMAQAGCDALL